MSTGNDIPFGDKLNCRKCGGRVKRARSLPCGHTFCAACIETEAEGSHGHVRCIECSKSFSIQSAQSCPPCFVINSFLDEIEKTFRPDGDISIGRHGFQSVEIFQCSICLRPYVDARYLYCGHSFCYRCLEQVRSDDHIRCVECRAEHALPGEGVSQLPTCHRINSIAAIIRANQNEPEDSCDQAQSQDEATRFRPRHRRPPVHDDIDQLKKRACADTHPSQQTHSFHHNGSSTLGYHPPRRPVASSMGAANKYPRSSGPMQVLVQLPHGKTIVIDVNANDSIASLKKKIRDITNIDMSQQNVFFNGKTLEKTRTLQFYGIGNRDTISVVAALQGG